MLFKYFSEITIVIISVQYILCVTHLCLVFIMSILGYFLSDESKLFMLFYVFHVTCTFIYITRHIRHTFIHICLHFFYSHIRIELYFMFSMSTVLLYFVCFLFEYQTYLYIYICLLFFILIFYVKKIPFLVIFVHFTS